MATYTIKDDVTGKVLDIEWEKETPPTKVDFDKIVADVRKQFAPLKPKESTLLSTPELGEYATVPGLPERAITEEGKPGFIERTVSNVPKSALEFGKAIVQPIIHPIETTKGVGKTILGATQLLLPGEQGYEQYAEALGSYFKERYGGWENIKKTMEEDPVGFAADAATFLTGAGAVVKGAGTLGKIGLLTKTGKTIEKVGSALEPLGLMAKGTSKIVGPVAKPILRETLGYTTGQRGTSTKSALGASEEFKAAMRGKVPEEVIVGEAKTGLGSIREERGLKYKEKLANLKQSKEPIDTSPIQSKLQELMSSDNFSITKNPTGDLDFTFSGIREAEIGDVNKIINLVENWKDTTPIGLDALKKKIHDLSPIHEGAGKSFAGKIENEIKNTVGKAVPEYSSMLKEYETFTKRIDDIEKGLSLGEKAPLETSMKKLIKTMREDNEFRKSMIEKIEASSGKNIQDLVAGYMMQDWMPHNMTGIITLTGAGVLSFLFNPKLATFMMSASPRLAGEFLAALTTGKKLIAKIPPVARETHFQAGRIGRGLPPFIGSPQLEE